MTDKEFAPSTNETCYWISAYSTVRVQAVAALRSERKSWRQQLEADENEADISEAPSLTGKWMIFLGEDEVDDVWRRIKEAVEGDRLWEHAKVTNAVGRRRSSYK